MAGDRLRVEIATSTAVAVTETNTIKTAYFILDNKQQKTPQEALRVFNLKIKRDETP